jgi:hypothetical protein
MAKTVKAKAGRKPKADGDRKDVTITARIPHDMHVMLLRQAKSSRKKQSQLMRDYLVRGIREESKGSGQYNSEAAEGFAGLMGALADDVEAGKRYLWTECAYVHRELVAAVGVVLFGLAPKEVLTPVESDLAAAIAQIEDSESVDSAYKPQFIELTKAMANPEFAGHALGRGFLDKLRLAKSPSVSELVGNNGSFKRPMRSDYDLPKIRKKLESKKVKAK